MQHHVPAASLDAVDRAREQPHVGRAAQMLDEIEAHAAHAAGIEPVEILVGETVVDDGDAAVARRVGRNAIEHGGIVAAVAARLHDHRARNAEMVVQRAQHFLRRVLRRVAPPGRVRKPLARPEHMAMRVGRARRQRKARAAPAFEEIAEFAVHVHCSAAFTRAGVNGRSRRRLPVACAKALAMAAAAGPIAASPTPSEGRSGRSMSTVCTCGTSGMVRIG